VASERDQSRSWESDQNFKGAIVGDSPVWEARTMYYRGGTRGNPV